MRTMRRVGFAVALLAIIGLISGCAAAPKPTIKIGFKTFTEQYLLRDMYTLLLQDAGYTVEQVPGLEETPRLHKALTEDTIDMYIEYTGTAARRILDITDTLSPQDTYSLVRQEYLVKYDLMWLDPAPMNNTWSFAMTPTSAAKYNIKTISEMVARADQLTVVGDVYFLEREDGIPGMKRAFGNFEFKRYIPVNSDDRYNTLISSQADVVIAYATDGELFAYNMVLLDDTTSYFPSYQPAPVVRQSLLDDDASLAPTLNKLAPLLTNSVMQQLNYEVSSKKRDSMEVAREFLTSSGLLKP